MASSSVGSPQGTPKEYIVRAPKNSKKKYNVMRFHGAAGVDFKTWKCAKIERENNMKEYKYDDGTPSFGAGSEFGREQREEARRKRYGISMKKYRPEDQPWLLQVGGKGGKKFKGIREGGVSDNVSWYVFMQGKDGAFEAYPVEEWYNFQPINRYKALNAEEAEKEFERRDKIMNYFSVMYQKKLKKEDEEDEEDGAAGKKKGPSSKNFQLSEVDEWISDNDLDDDEEENDRNDKESADSDDDMKKKKKPLKGSSKRGGKSKKTESGETDDECIEESDDYDEGAELGYLSSDSSSTDEESYEKVSRDLAGVEDDDALKRLLNSDEEEEEEEEEEEDKEIEKEDKEDEVHENEEKDRSKEREKKKKKKKKKDKRIEAAENRSSDDSDSEMKKKSKGEHSKKNVMDLKRKLQDPQNLNPAKKVCLGEGSSVLNSPPTSETGVTDETIHRYLMRKPMTTKELLQKFKSKKTGLTSEQLVHAIAQILKKLNPVKQMIKGKMYLSIKS